VADVEVEAPLYLSDPRGTEGRHDYVSMIEAGYEADGDDRAWLAGILRSVRSALDRGGGVFACIVERPARASAGSFTVSTPVMLDCPPALPEALTAGARQLSPEDFVRHLRASPCATAGQSVSAEARAIQEAVLRPFGVVDIQYVRALNPDLTGLMLSAPAPDRRRLHPRQAASLSRVAAHLAAALRLRRHRGGRGADAVLDPGGRLLHAEGDARDGRCRQTLTAAAQAVARSRGPLRRRHPTEAISLWRALVAGRWSLVDSVDRDGKRFLLARANVPDAPEPMALAPAERRVAALFALGHSQKLISYELGLAPATVSALAAAALGKLGLRSRSELVRLFG
jgi:DNA-binding CsgD family transcriptional regulator